MWAGTRQEGEVEKEELGSEDQARLGKETLSHSPTNPFQSTENQGKAEEYRTEKE